MDSIKLITAPMVATRGLDAAVQPNQSRVQIPLHEVWQQGGNVFFFSNRTVLRHVQHKLPTHSRILSTKLQNQLMGLEQFPRPQTADTARWKVKKIETRRRMWTILAGGGVGETTESVSTSDEEILEDLKQALMRAVSNTNRGKDTTYQQRQAILTLIEKLEELNPTRDPVDSPLFSGRWALLYTSPIDEKTADKYAGTEEGPFLARVKPAAFGSVRQTRSTQVLDTLGGTAQNIADFKFFGLNGSLNIKGSVIKAAPMSKGSIRVDVTFESFVLKIGNWTSPSISLSWINPKGWIDTTFLDKGMRVGRGDKGSIFVAVPMKEA